MCVWELIDWEADWLI